MSRKYRYKSRSKKNMTEVAVLLIIIVIVTKMNYLEIITLSQKVDWIIVSSLIVLSILIPFAYKKYMKDKKYKEYLNNPIYIIDRQEGNIFEEQLAALFKKQGYKVEIVGQSHDYGCDLIIIKDGIKYAVQAKRYKANVGIQAVQQILGAKEYYKADRAIVCTNSHFTKSAINLANSSNVILWDRQELKKYLKK